MNTFNKFINILIKFMIPLVIVAMLLGIARVILDNFEHHRIKLTFITDAALVFVLREIMIGTFQHSVDSREGWLCQY